jgi:predicted protein tyrosine phosphatase
LKRVLFVCSQNLLRSPTAERIFSRHPGIEARSAGTDPGAAQPVTAELLDWADAVFVMEERHRILIARRFRAQLERKRVIVLGIPDVYEFMAPELVRLLEAKVHPFLSRQC